LIGEQLFDVLCSQICHISSFPVFLSKFAYPKKSYVSQLFHPAVVA
jgi:hypothetical protein